MNNCGSCGAQILWVETSTGKWVPLDPDMVPDGNVEVYDGVAVVIANSSVGSRDRYKSHFATCPNAGQHRKRK